MKNYLILATAFLSLNSASAAYVRDTHAAPSSPAAAGGATQSEIKQLLKSYEQALNSSSPADVVGLYADDGVLMAPENPPAVGVQAVKSAYIGIFQALKLNIKFQIAEVQALSPEWAFMRTSSTGGVKILATRAEVPEGNQELFVLHKVGGKWKIARYSFSSYLRAP
jgi:uncharacterized protein (TIGR02246 family)